jgi:1-acyl-sn-glycerol-3-phosphate acyltransferase
MKTAQSRHSPRRTFTYTSPTQDFVASPHQHFQLPDNYVWYHGNSLLHRCAFYSVYFIFFIIGWVYLAVVLHVRIVGKSRLKACRGRSYFVYANHTQPFGDIALTVVLNWPHRISAVVATANIGIPVIGSILHHFDFLAVPHTNPQRAAYKKAMTHLVHDGVAFQIYPEAHVWPYDTTIRPYTNTSMRYPVRFHAPSFCATLTYQHRKHGKKPKATLYVDGPFYPRVTGSEETEKQDLYEQIRSTMVSESKKSTYAYYHYKNGRDTPQQMHSRQKHA